MKVQLILIKYLSQYYTLQKIVKCLKKCLKIHIFRGGKSFNNSDVNLISEECLQTCHPGLLYHLALQISPLGNSEELF